jgi:hypothetical protein
LHEIFYTIATTKLNIEELKLYFKASERFETTDIIAFYRQLNPGVNPKTVNWRVYSLVQLGIINRVGRGIFMLGSQHNYLPDISTKIKSIYSKIKKEFPFLNICVWNTSSINEFMRHQPGRFYFLIEVEKDSIQSVFYYLKELNYAVFSDPSSDILEKYLPNNKDILIVKSLVTEAPTQNFKGIDTISLEKLLVDIFCDDVIFAPQQGSEMRTIFETALTKYAINQSRMLRYANRKGKKDSFTKYFNSISNYRQ